MFTRPFGCHWISTTVLFLWSVYSSEMISSVMKNSPVKPCAVAPGRVSSTPDTENPDASSSECCEVSPNSRNAFDTSVPSIEMRSCLAISFV